MARRLDDLANLLEGVPLEQILVAPWAGTQFVSTCACMHVNEIECNSEIQVQTHDTITNVTFEA